MTTERSRDNHADLAPAVLQDLERVGAVLEEYPTDVDPSKIKIGETIYEMPPALAKFHYRYKFRRGGSYSGCLGNFDLTGLHFWAHGYADEYSLLNSAPYLEFGATGDYCMLFVRLDDPRPDDPQVWYLDHDDFGEAHDTNYRIRLSTFLQTLEAEPAK